MKVVHVVGARPQFIKVAVVSRAMRGQGSFREIFIHTGQHFDDNMSGIFFRELGLPHPQYNLGIDSLSNSAMTGRMLEKAEKILAEEKPDIVMVYGDTNSTLAGALAAAQLQLRVAHVEAGLRSFNRSMPEETNRIIADRLSSWLFCPTVTAVQNLEREGYATMPCKIVRCGDVMLDAALHFSASKEVKGRSLATLPKDYLLCTMHRLANTEDADRLRSIVQALNRLNKERPVVLPLHPRTRKALQDYKIHFEGQLLEPVGYLDMLNLIRHCRLVLTDSGGLQKESYFFEKHCVTLREDTEWPELVQHGFNTLAGADEEKIVTDCRELLNKKSDFSMDLFGNGKAAEGIVKSLLEQ